MKQYFELLLVAVVFAFTVHSVHSKPLQESMLGEVPHIETEMSLDGIVDDVVWDQALRITLETEVSPGINVRAQQKTTAFIFENGTDLYIGFKAFDDKPSDIRAFHSERDKIWSSDVVGVKLDPLNSGRTAYQFFVTPLGIQADSVLNDSSDKEDTGWDSIWYAKSKIHDQGYDVEIRIPLDSMRTSSQKGLKSWGIELVRFLPRDVLHEFSSQSKSKNQQCDVCQFKKIVGFSKQKTNSNITLIPSVTLKRTDNLTDGVAQRWIDGDVEERGSLDFRWGINQNTFFNGTINPDFSQVEADALQLDVNSLSVLSLEEKRPFFIDGTEYFKHWSRFIYTRIFSEPKVGMKITSTQDQHHVGAMLLEDKNTDFIVPYSRGSYLVTQPDVKSRNTMFRYRYDLEQKSHLGLTITDREGDEYSNRVLGVDGKFWFGESDFIKFQAFRSDAKYPLAIVEEFEGLVDAESPLLVKESMADNAFSFAYTHADKDWIYDLTYHQFGADFRADTGFISVSNWQRTAFGAKRFWYSDASWWNTFSVLGRIYETNEIEGGNIDEVSDLFFQIEGLWESSIGLEFRDKLENYNGQAFSRDSKEIWLELQPFSNASLEFLLNKADAIYYSAALPARSQTIISELDVQVSNRVDTNLEWINQELDLSSGAFYEVSLTNLKTTFRFDDKQQLRLTLQYRDVEFIQQPSNSYETLGSQLLYSYQVNPFTLVYLGYSDSAETSNIDLELTRDTKTLFVKFSYAWQY